MRPLRLMVAVATLLIGFSLIGVASALPASASTDFSSFSPPLTGATDFATDFPNTGGGFGIGPIGMIDDGTNFFVSDYDNGLLYKFPITGGDAATVPSADDGLFGLALSDGVYFGTNLAGGVETFDPSTLAVSSTNVTLPCGDEGIAADPLSTDLYVDTTCGVYRVQNPTSASPTVTLFSTSITADTFDGISISSDGQEIWAADTTAGEAVEFSRSGTVIQTVADSDGLDGTGIVRPGVTSGGINVSNNVFINNNDGTITRVDTNNSDATSTVATGGSRGDLVITGPDGCLYATQSDRIEKLAPCFFQPTGRAETTTATSLSGGGQSGSSISVPTNTAVTDSASLTGANAATATGTITYDVYSDAGCTTTVSTGTPETITTPGTLPSSSPVTLSTGGTYYWQASYSGDANNEASASACGSEVETVAGSGQLKVCKIAGTPALLGQNFTFTEAAGGTTSAPFDVTAGTSTPLNCGGLTTYPVGTPVSISELATPGVRASSITVKNGTKSNENLSAGTVTATVGGTGTTVVVYTNVQSVQPPGYIEVCKKAGDSYVPAGPWTFTITNTAGAVVGTEYVLSGQCSGDVAVAPGQYTVGEQFSSPDYVSSIQGDPSATLLADNLANGTGVFSVAGGATTTATFTNDTTTSYVKVCKTLTDNSGALAGTTFSFNVNDVAGTQLVSVIAPPVGQTACSEDDTALPVGSAATITEQGQADVAVTGVSITPPAQNAGSTSTTGSVTVGPSVVAATFTNEALGWVEVCKNAADPSTATRTFSFSINGGAKFPVAAGQCSQPYQAPAGAATVREIQRNPNFYLQSVTAVGYPEGNALLSGPTPNGTVTVGVPYGGIGDETVVTFTDAVQTGYFKICSAQASLDANLQGEPFVYHYSYKYNGTTSAGSVSLIDSTSGSTCSGVYGPIPVVNPNGKPVKVSVTEEPPGITDVDLASVGYAGSGKVLSSPSTPTTLPATISFTIAQGVGVTTFTDGRTS